MQQTRTHKTSRIREGLSLTVSILLFLVLIETVVVATARMTEQHDLQWYMADGGAALISVGGIALFALTDVFAGWIQKPGHGVLMTLFACIMANVGLYVIMLFYDAVNDFGLLREEGVHYLFALITTHLADAAVLFPVALMANGIGIVLGIACPLPAAPGHE